MNLYDDDEPVKFRPGTRLTKTVTFTIIKHDVNKDTYTVIDTDGDTMELPVETLHDPTWIVIPDA